MYEKRNVGTKVIAERLSFNTKLENALFVDIESIEQNSYT